MRRKVLFFTILCTILCTILFSSPLMAQGTLKVHGQIKDKEGVPIAGVSVLIKGSKKGTISDQNGMYSIKTKTNAILVFSFIGFDTIELKVKKALNNITMFESHASLDQVVVTGYSQTNLRKSTGAVAVIKSDILKDAPLKNVDQLLQGKMAGVVVQNTSGRPGARARVRIRGINTITGNSEPLWVIDGVPLQKSVPISRAQINANDFDNIFTTGIGSVNPNDIESITVLKDASAAAIYGSQASSGVIVVKTKSGSVGKPSVSYSASLSMQTKPSRSVHLMNSKEKLAWEQELWNEFSDKYYKAGQRYPRIGVVGLIRSKYGKYADLTPKQQDALIEQLAGHSTDWFGELFHNTFSQSHYLSLSGGTPKVSYYLSGGVSYDNGIVKKTGTNNYTFNSKIDLRPNDIIKLGFSSDFSYMKAYAPSNNVNMFKYAYFANPYERPYNPDGSYKADETYFSASTANGAIGSKLPPQGFNIMREINETYVHSSSTLLNLKANTMIKFTKNLNFTGLASFTYSADNSENVNGERTYAAWTDRPFDDISKSKRQYGSITQLASNNIAYLLRGQFNYNLQFASKHSINAIAGSEIRSSYAKSLISKRYGYDPVTGNHSTPLFLDNGSNMVKYSEMINFANIMDGLNVQSRVQDAFASFYGTATYNYNSKYMLSATLRSDGSNNFGSKEQFNANWSLSAAWNVDEELWMLPYKKVISNLSFRAGYGYTGGVNKTVFPELIMNYLPEYRKSATHAYRMGEIRFAPNPNLRWEKTRTINVGMNLGLFKNRINAELSYYRNKNLDQVTRVKVVSSTGFDTQSYNTSEQINNGFELMLSFTPIKLDNFTWRLSSNISYNYNELVKYDSPTGNILSDYYVHYPLGKIISGKYLGVNANTGMPEFELRPDADIRKIEDYRDYQNYLYYLGTSFAPWNGGFSTSFTYKNLSLNISGNYSLGAKTLSTITSPVSANNAGGKRNEVVLNGLNDLYTNYLNVTRDVRNRWTSKNHNVSGYPRLIDAYGPKLVGDNGELLDLRRISSHIITQAALLQDISYFKLSSISLMYSLPYNLVRSMGLKSMSMGLLLNNLFIISNYKGLDPESPGAVYPQARSFSLNVSLNF